MSWQEGFYEAVADLIRRYDKTADVAEVVSFEDKTVNLGYCETCWYETTVCEVTYLDSKGITRTYEFYETFAELVRDLTSQD